MAPSISAWTAKLNPQTLFSRRHIPSTARSVFVNQPLPSDYYDAKGRAKKEHVYATNQVLTSKYTIITFLPRNLLEQFRRVANVFFAAIAILQFFPKFSTISPGLVILPLLAILLITALKDGYEDIKRHQSDRRVNHSPIRILQSPEWENPNPMQGKSRTFTPGRGTEVTPWGIYRAWRLRKKHMAQQQGDAEKAGTTPVNGISVQSPGRPRPPHDRATSDPISFVSTAPSAAPPAGKIDVHGSRWAPSFWEDVRVGDFLYIQNGDSIPADVLVISTSEPESVAFVETKNLDGETNLKSRHAITELGVALNGNPDEVMKSGPWRVDVEAPEVNMYKLNGAAVVPHDDGERRFPIDMQTVLLRGTVLRNTKWVVALVLFTGTDTKIVMNSGDTPSKRSRVERQMNPQVFINLIILATMAVVCGIVDSILETRSFNGNAYWTVDDDLGGDNPHINGLITFAFALITFQNIIPISLYISIEFVRTCQAAFIYFDSEIYYAKTDTPTLARSWNLSDDLGQVEYIFSDKTGTLTQNSMIFRRCSVMGKVYEGDLVNDDGSDSASNPDGTPKSVASSDETTNVTVQPVQKETHIIPPASEVRPQIEEGESESAPKTKLSSQVLTRFKDSTLFTDIKAARSATYGSGFSTPGSSGGRDDPKDQYRSLKGFFSCLALCHTVLASTDPETGEIEYKAQSPDEAALVQAAADVGFVFQGRDRSTQVLKLRTPFGDHVEEYELLNVLDFTSSRKRMSVIVRSQDGKVIVFCKGADNVIFERLREGGDEIKAKTEEDLDKFANEGLRTLCLAYRVVAEQEYASWNRRYHDATVSLDDRDHEIDVVSEEIEQEFYLLGATAIEDKLQDGVPETIADFKRAGIKVWVATGDKLETAIAIGYSTNLIARDSNLVVVRGGSAKSAYSQMIKAVEQFFPNSGILDSEDLLTVQEGKSHTMIRSTSGSHRMQRTQTGLSGIVGGDNGRRPGGFVLVIDGSGLNEALGEEYSKQVLLQLSIQCEAVICCRVSPKQKAEMVRLIKDGLKVMTLAIGDGANDVSMIQAADVGVGIAGEEGMQAVNSSDYAIAQFRFLKRLLFVHGQWSYARNSNMILNFFYKNIVCIGVLWWFQIYCGWSTQYVFEYTYLLFWNVFWSLAPVIAIGIFDRNIDDDILMAIPELYRYGREGRWFGSGTFVVFMLDGIYQSAIIFFLLMYTYVTTSSRTDGYDVYMYEFSTTMVIAAVMIVNLFHGLCTSAWTGWIWFAVSIGIILVWAYTAVYSIIAPGWIVTPVYGNDHYLFHSAYFWLSLPLIICLAILPRYLSRAVRITYSPNDIDIMRIVRKYQHKSKLDIAEDPNLGGHYRRDELLKDRRSKSMADDGREEENDIPMELPPRPRPADAWGSRTDMSTGEAIAPGKGFDFSMEEGGVAMRRMQTNLSERSFPSANKRRRGSLSLSGLRNTLRRKVSTNPLHPKHNPPS